MPARREQGVWVNADDERATIIVNADGTAVSAGGGGGVSIVDDSAFTVAVSSLTVAGGIVTADAVDSGDAGAFAMLANRQQKVSLYDSSGVEITSFGGGTQYTEDAAAAANPVGGAIIAVRDDARGGSLTTTDGDNVALRGTNAGELYVKHVDAIAVTLAAAPTTAVTNAGLTELAAAINASAQMDVNIAASNATVTVAAHAVTNAGTFVVQENGAALTALQLIDDPVATLGTTTYTEAASKGMLVGAVRRDADTTLVDTTNEVSPLQVDANGRLKVEAFSGETLPVSLASVPSHAVTNAGTFAVQVDGAALTALQLIDDTVYAEDVAAQAADKGLAILAVRRDADTSLVDATGDYANLQVNAAGSLKVAITAGAGSGGTAIADEAAFTIGSTSLTPIGGQYNSAPDSLADGSAGIAHMTIKRALHVSLRDATTGAEVSVGGGTQYDEDTASADAQKLTMAGVTRADTAASQVTTDGDRSTLIVDSTGRLHVNVGNTVTVGTHAVTNAAGAFVVQENGAALTALQLIDDIVYTDDTSTHATGTSKGALMMAAATPTDTAVNANDIGAVAMTVDRKLQVAVMDALPAGTANIGDVDVLTVPADPFGANADAGSATGSISAKLRFIAATGIPITGTVTVGSHAVTVASGGVASGAIASGAVASGAVASGAFASGALASGSIAAGAIADMIVDDAAFTPATSRVLMAGFQADESSTDSVDEGDAGAARMTLDRKVIVTTLPHTAGGLTTFMASGSDGSSILVATAQAIKASAGQLYGYYAYNPEAAVTFVHFYNTAQASVTVGTTNPMFTVAIPPASAANLAIPQGIVFSNAGWSCAATTTAGGTGAPATGVSLVVWYA